MLSVCPRCKQKCLYERSYGESGLYKSKHRICVPCFHDEFEQISREGNDLPDVLKSYGPENSDTYL